MADQDIAAVVAQADLPAIASTAIDLKVNGSEYKARCVFHSPDNHPSLHFFHKGGKWQFKCFSCGEGGDALDWVEKLEGCTTAEALKKLNGGGLVNQNFKPKAVKPLPSRSTFKPPADAPYPDMRIPRIGGDPVKVWTYKDAAGELLGYVARYERDGSKEFRCWTWGTRGPDPAGWAMTHWSKPRPLYGLDRLATRTGAPVMIVEGEKAADAAQALLPHYVVIAWPGGANAWKHADLEPLRGKRVDFWPDNDEPGIEAMKALAALISGRNGLGCHGKIIDPSGMADGFDAADWPADAGDPMDWLRGRASVYAEKPSDTPPEPQGDDLPPVEAYEGDVPPDDGDGPSLPAEMSEDFLALRFADAHGERWRYVKPWGAWFEWRGDGWYRDDTAKVDRLAVELTRQAIYWPQARALTPAAMRLVNSRRTAGAVRDLALSDRRIAATVDQWDTDPLALGVPGGVVDLRDGRRLEASAGQYITKRTMVAPAEGDAPIWRQFLETVTLENGELIGFLQTFAGYCLTGETREQCFAFLYGTGQNGKGVFINTLRRIMGDYAISSSADVFMESDHSRHPTEMARLRGARLVAVDETDGRKRWNEERIKRITGGGKIEAHFMRQDDFEFEPQFKILVAGNHKPQLRGVGKAIQRRIHLIPFTVTIPDESRDDRLVQKLESEYPQILAWMIAGCIRWQAEGLRAPELVRQATTNYIEAEDTIGEWLDERTEQSGQTERPAAYKNYRAWCDGRGEKAWAPKFFWQALEEKGFVARKSHGTWYIVGLSLKLQAASEPGYEVP